MKNKELDDYYPTVLAAAMINVGFIEFKIAAVNDKTVGDSGAKMGFNRTAFVEDVKAVTNIILARRNADIKFDIPNDNEISND